MLCPKYTIVEGRAESTQPYRGSFLGLAIGDALGMPFEFLAQGSVEPVKEMAGGGGFGLSAGYWAGDTSIALCLAESLIERCEFNPIDQLA